MYVVCVTGDGLHSLLWAWLQLIWARPMSTSSRITGYAPETAWRPGSARIRWGSLSAPPDPLAAVKGLPPREGKGERGGKGKEGGEKGGKEWRGEGRQGRGRDKGWEGRERGERGLEGKGSTI